MKRVVDWAEVTDAQIVEGDKGLVVRLHGWLDPHLAGHRTVTQTYDTERHVTRYEVIEYDQPV